MPDCRAGIIMIYKISKKGKIKALKSGVAKIVVKDKQKRQLAKLYQ